jgi:predicted component of type VI protein secretion system
MPDMELTLVMFKQNGQRREFPLNKALTVIGRGDECDLQIPLVSISRKHCRIKIQDNTAMIEDLESSNGTYHNNQRVDTAEPLSAGDYVRIGPVNFTVVINGEPQQIKPIRSIIGEAAIESNSAGAQRADAGEIPLAAAEEIPLNDDIPVAQSADMPEGEIPVAQPIDATNEIFVAEPVEDVEDSDLNDDSHRS